MQQVFFDLYQLLQICDENDIFYSIFPVLLSCLYTESAIWLFMYRDALFYLSNRKKKSSKYEWTYWTLFCVTFIVMSSWK